MDLSFVNNLRKIVDEDERIVTITLLIDIITNLINDRKNYRHHTLPNSYIQEMFQKYQGAMQCLNIIGFKQVLFCRLSVLGLENVNLLYEGSVARGYLL